MFLIQWIAILSYKTIPKSIFEYILHKRIGGLKRANYNLKLPKTVIFNLLLHTEPNLNHAHFFRLLLSAFIARRCIFW